MTPFPHARPAVVRLVGTLLTIAAIMLPAAILLAVMGPSASAAGGGLQVVVIPASAAPGTTIRITGEGWPANGRLQMMTCGNLGRGGTPSCDVTRTYTVVANAAGAFETYGTMGKPPVPCPCVVHVVDADSYRAVDIPVTVLGQKTAEPPPPSGGTIGVPAVQVVSTTLSGWGPFLSLFGAGPQRTLALTVRNTTGGTIDSADLRFVEGASGGDQPITVGPLAPNQIKTFDVPVTLSAGVGGHRSLTATLDDGPQFVAETTSYAWGFYVLDVILLLLLIWVVVWRLRNRRPAPEHIGRHGAGTTPATAEPVDTSPIPFP